MSDVAQLSASEETPTSRPPDRRLAISDLTDATPVVLPPLRFEHFRALGQLFPGAVRGLPVASNLTITIRGRVNILDRIRDSGVESTDRVLSHGYETDVVGIRSQFAASRPDAIALGQAIAGAGLVGPDMVSPHVSVNFDGAGAAGQALVEAILSGITEFTAVVDLDGSVRLVGAAEPAQLAASGDKEVDGPDEPLDVGNPERTAHPGTVALAQLQGWLHLPLDELQAVAGLAPSTRAYWRNHPMAPIRPGKTGRLLRFRTAVGLLVGLVGVERARALLHQEGWLTRKLDEPRLVALEARVSEVLVPEGLLPPAHLRAGLSGDQLRAAALSGIDDELAQQARERGQTTEPGPADDDPEP